jgi:hypothetical protein
MTTPPVVRRGRLFLAKDWWWVPAVAPTTDGSDAPGWVWNAVVPDQVRAPVILSAVLSMAGAVAIYPFVLAQFESRRPALLVALAFALYPAIQPGNPAGMLTVFRYRVDFATGVQGAAPR